MERIQSTDLFGANAYFTNFDNRIVYRVDSSQQELLIKSVERNLKVLLLTKNNVVCAASHLINPLTYNLIKDNPILLEKHMIIPAFRSDKKEISELFIGKNLNKEKEANYLSLYEDLLTKTVLWNLQENSGWFRDTFIAGLRNDKSVIRTNLTNIKEERIKQFVDEIQKRNILDRSSIEKLAKGFNANNKRAILNYRELIYHMSGARVVNCESTLPQENYIDYSLTDLENHTTQLSELQVFWKIFMELMLESINKTRFRVEELDLLSYEEIYEMRKPIQESSFIEKYNDFYKSAANVISNSERMDILYSAEELMKIRESLVKQIKEVSDKQYEIYLNRILKDSTKELISNSISLAIDQVPFLGNVKSVYAYGKHTWFNLNQAYKSKQALEQHDIYINYKENLLRKTIQKFGFHNKSEMLDMVRLIRNTIAEKSKI